MSRLPSWSRQALWACVSFWALQACSLPAHIDDDLFANLSTDRKLLLFDAENDVSQAEDAQAQMRERLADLREQRRMAAEEANWAEAEANEIDVADMRAGPAQAMQTWRLRGVYLLEATGYLRQRLAVQGKIIDAARARFELTKAQQAQKEKLLSHDKVDLPRFVAQVNYYTGVRDRALQALMSRQRQCERARQAWLEQREDLVAHNIQKIGMVGADEVPVWELW